MLGTEKSLVHFNAAFLADFNPSYNVILIHRRGNFRPLPLWRQQQSSKYTTAIRLPLKSHPRWPFSSRQIRLLSDSGHQKGPKEFVSTRNNLGRSQYYSCRRNSNRFIQEPESWTCFHSKLHAHHQYDGEYNNMNRKNRAYRQLFRR